MFSLRPDISGIKRKFPVSALGMALCCGMAIGGAHADSTCGVLSATYLLTALNSDGSFAARQLITLTEDRNVIVNDSAEGGVPGVFNPFTTAQGTGSVNRDLRPSKRMPPRSSLAYPDQCRAARPSAESIMKSRCTPCRRAYLAQSTCGFFRSPEIRWPLLCRLRTRASLSPACA